MRDKDEITLVLQAKSATQVLILAAFSDRKKCQAEYVIFGHYAVYQKTPL